MGKRTKITPELVQQVRELRASGMPIKEIQKQAGVAYNTVVKLTDEMENVRRAAPRLSAERVETIRRLYEEGKPYMQIRLETGASYQAIQRCTKDLPRRKKGNHQSNDLPAEKIEEIRELRRSGLLIREAAAVAGVTVYMVRKYTQDIITTEDKLQQTGQPGTLCRHKETCRYWRPLSGLGGGVNACHYPIDRNELRPWPADQCPGFPGPKTGPNPTPMGIKRKE